MEAGRARALLGLAPDAAPDVVRRRYHLLARDAHPDAGGDPEEFLELQHAYAALLDAEPDPTGRSVPRRAAENRDRLARRQREREHLPHVDVEAIDWELPGPRTPTPATVELLARVAARSGDGVVAPTRIVSRGPRSISNRFAHALEDSLVASFEIGADLGNGRHGLRASGSGRRGRRLLDPLHAEPLWQMVRRNSDVVAASRPVPSAPDVRRTALLHATLASDLLASLAWPLQHWLLVDPLA